MKSDEYIQILKASQEIDFVDIDNIVECLDDIRKIQIKLQKELEYLLSDPTSFEEVKTRENINYYAKNIKELAIESNIQYEFQKIPQRWDNFREKFKDNLQFVKYSCNSIDITNLLVFTKRKKVNKKKNNKESEVMDFDTNGIKELDLDFDTPAQEPSFLMDDINDLPGTPLAFNK